MKLKIQKNCEDHVLLRNILWDDGSGNKKKKLTSFRKQYLQENFAFQSE